MEGLIAAVIVGIIVAFFIFKDKNKKKGTGVVQPELTDKEIQDLTDEAENRDRIKK